MPRARKNNKKRHALTDMKDEMRVLWNMVLQYDMHNQQEKAKKCY